MRLSVWPDFKQQYATLKIFFFFSRYHLASWFKLFLLASMFLWRTLNLHGTFSLLITLFIVEKGCFDYLNVLHTLKCFFSNNCSLTSQKIFLLWHHLKPVLDDLKPKISISFNFSPSQKSHYPILENNILSLARKS